jgi:hypothetical protein
MSRRPSTRSRHYVVERESTPMHEDQFRAPDRRDADEEEEEDDDDDADEDGLLRAMGSTTTTSRASVRARERRQRRNARAYRNLSIKTKLLGPCLFVAGAMMLATYALFAVGAVELRDDVERGTSTALVVVGSMCALAGGYSTVVMVMAWRGEPGWSYSMIPGE